MSVRTVFSDVVAERTTLRYEADLLDEAGAVLGPSDLSTLTLTIYALDAARTVVNGVDRVNVLNVGRGSFDPTTKRFRLTLQPADNQLVTNATEETHVLLLEWTWAAGAKAGRHEIEIRVRNLDRV
ncbi:MAG TPA: hypothetical protein VNJ53_07815 [Gaiellaceae bacterium]|nr:hypothetical protein [Gaiellaceae bacterium]